MPGTKPKPSRNGSLINIKSLTTITCKPIITTLLCIIVTMNTVSAKQNLIDSEKINAYVINLARSKTRLNYVMPKVKALGIHTQRIEAVDGQKLNMQTIAKVLAPDYSSYMGKYPDTGSIGCALSHIKTWQACLASDAEFALILEDDIGFDPKTLTTIITALIHKKDQWDIAGLQLAHRGWPVTKAQLTNQHRMVIYLSKVTNSGAYLLNRKAAARLLKNALPIHMALDHYFFLSWKHDINLVGVEPRVVQQSHGSSEINDGVRSHIFFPHQSAYHFSIGHEIYKIQIYLYWLYYSLLALLR